VGIGPSQCLCLYSTQRRRTLAYVLSRSETRTLEWSLLGAVIDFFVFSVIWPLSYSSLFKEIFFYTSGKSRWNSTEVISFVSLSFTPFVTFLYPSIPLSRSRLSVLRQQITFCICPSGGTVLNRVATFFKYVKTIAMWERHYIHT
jgi:hypothetical protein